MSAAGQMASASQFSTVEAMISSLDGKTSEGTFEVKSLSAGDRALVALKRLAIFWGIALAFLPIPAVHFVAVPAFLLIGAVAFAQAWTVSKRIEEGEGTCPNCGEKMEFDQLRYQTEFKERCPHCRHEMRFRLGAGPQKK